jgi:hypothetical protein
MHDLERAIETIGTSDNARAVARHISFDEAASSTRLVASIEVARAGQHDAQPVGTLPLPIEHCDCMGFRLGGVAYCTHQHVA